MKKTIWIASLLLGLTALLGACDDGGSTDAPGSFTIRGKIINGGGQTIYLQNIIANQYSNIDSVVISDDGEFELVTWNVPLDYYRMSLNDNDIMWIITDSTETVYVEATAGALGTTYAVTGSPNTQLLVELYRQMETYDSEIERLRNRYNASEESDTAERRVVQETSVAMYNENLEYLKGFVDEHTNSPAAMAAIARLDERMYLDYHKKVAAAMQKSMPRSPNTIQLVSRITYAEQAIAQEQQQQQEANRMANLLAPGTMAPDITQNSPSGQPISLSSLQGKIVLIDFWASWCKPCRAENPNVVKLYEKYKGSGFEIYSVSLDNNMAKWQAAIQQDGLSWPSHVSDLAAWNSAAAALYGVRSIPFTVLLDRDGKVIATKLRGAGLEAQLQDLFGF